MANIRTGSIVADIRGKVGDEIYSRNRGGAFVKAYVSPVQPDTAMQITARADMAAAVAAWQSLSDTERNQWNTYAMTRNPENIALKGRRSSGYNLFIERALNLRKAGFTDDPQPFDSLIKLQVDLTFTTCTTTNLRLDIVRTPVGGSSSTRRYIIFASGPVSSGVMSPNSVTYVFMQVASVPTSNASFFITAWTNRFGSPAGFVGSKIFVKVHCVNVSRQPLFPGPFVRSGEQCSAPVFASNVISA